MNEAAFFQDELLATEFFVPVLPQPFIPRPRLNEQLSEDMSRKLIPSCCKHWHTEGSSVWT